MLFFCFLLVFSYSKNFFSANFSSAWIALVYDRKLGLFLVWSCQLLGSFLLSDMHSFVINYCRDIMIGLFYSTFILIYSIYATII